MKRFIRSLAFTLVLGLLCACGLQRGTETPASQTNEPVATTLQPVASDTADSPKQLVYIERIEGWDNVRAEFIAAVEKLSEEQGWEFQAYLDSPDQELLEHAALIVVFGGDADLTGLIEANPHAMYILVGVPGASPGDRVAVIGPEGMRPDQIAFLSGYISALTTFNWRVGVIGVGVTGAGQAALRSFINGGVFFCGLCRPSYAPFPEYPTSVNVPASDGENIVLGLNQLRELGVTTIGVTHEFSSGAIDLAIEEAKTDQFLWIGTNPPVQEKQGQWIATVQPDPASVLGDILRRLLQGEVNIIAAMPLDVRDVNEAILTEGKLRVVLETRDALVLGTTDTGVDPQTGLER